MKDIKTNHPGIYKRGDKYRIIYRVDGRRKVETFRTLTEAKKAKRQRESARDRGDLVLNGGQTFEEYAREWIDRYQGKGRGFSDATREAYRRDLERYAYPRIGHMRLNRIKHRDIADWVAWLAKQESHHLDPQTRKKLPFAEATIKAKVAAARSVFGSALREDGLIQSNPCERVVIPNQYRPETANEGVKALTRDQLGRFLEAVDADWELMFRLLAETGIRWSELVALTWGDLTLEGHQPQLKVRRAFAKGELKEPKSKYGRRSIPLSRSTADRLKAKWEASLPDAQALVYQGEDGDRLPYPKIKQGILDVAAREIGEPWIGFHTFRHTCASLMIAQGRNLKQVQRIMGHHSASFTLDTYGHLLDEGVGEAIDLDAEIALV